MWAWFSPVAMSIRLPPMAVEAVLSRVAVVSPLLAPGFLFSFWRFRFIRHNDMVLMIARSWWRVLVGCEFGGARWNIKGVVLWGSGQIHVGFAGIDDVSPSGATLPS
jgi:hypothetical protein